MEQKPDRTTKPSRDLVPAMDNLPAPVRMQEGQLADIRGVFAQALAEETRYSGGKMAVAQIGYLALLVGGGVTALIAATPAALPVAFFGGLLLATVGLFGYPASGANYAGQFEFMGRNVRSELWQAWSGFERRYRQAQEQAFDEKLKHAVMLADKHLAQGGLFDETVLAYLVTIKLEYFREASDQLAITVLQARRMLAHMRADEGESVPRMLTFFRLMREHRMAANPLSPDSRRTLRSFLEDSDKGFSEYDYSNDFPRFPYQYMEQSRDQEKKLESLSESGGILRAFFLLPFLSQDRKRVEAVRAAMTLPEADSIEVELPALRPVKGFAKAVAQYEEQNGRLDLPAVYGWENGSMKGRMVGARPALPGPERNIFP